MKLQFDASQDYQLAAVRAVVRLFEGQALSENTRAADANQLLLSQEQILQNLQAVQKENGILPSDALVSSVSQDGQTTFCPLNFTIEMETGTGKTYTFLRSIYELNKVYGFKKFVIVVPSVAIREGVIKNLQITHDHFQELYGHPPLNFLMYERNNRSGLRNFCYTNTIQILVINIDSFTKDSNVIHSVQETGIKPIAYIQATRPIVIIDEPQNFETDIRRQAIAQLHPLCTLRYSATHRHLYNLVYALNPVQAYDLGLVKQIEVEGITNNKTNQVLGQEDIFRFQIERTIRWHFEKVKKLREQRIKVLSLFFVDKVSNYRQYDTEGNPIKGVFARWFEECFEKVKANYPGLLPFSAAEVHNGYFSRDKKKQHWTDTKGSTQKDHDTYALIMQDKERLLSLDEPLQFVFSHSALREGWDNPNVFQICTLNQSQSDLKKRQEIGRGLRLPVDSQGRRIRDKNLNILTIIANESYQDFSRKLQKEIQDETSVNFAGRIRDAQQQQPEDERAFTPQNFPQLFALWQEIQAHTRIAISYDTPTLIRQAVRQLQQMPSIRPPQLDSQTARLSYDQSGISSTNTQAHARQIRAVQTMPDVYAYLQSKIDLTRPTIYQILMQSERLHELSIHPQLFLDRTLGCIRRAMGQMLQDGVSFERDPKGSYQMRLFVFEEIEHVFQGAVSNQESFKKNNQLFLELPKDFHITTPIGDYTPDWAIAFGQKVYFVRHKRDLSQELHETLKKMKIDVVK